MKMSRPALGLVFAVILGLLAPAPTDAFTVPAGFIDQPVVSGTPAPTAIDWLPDGTLLIATQGGILYRSNGGPVQVMLNLSDHVCPSGEMGLLGLAVDPDFDAGSRFLYLFYTNEEEDGGCGNADTRANRVVRVPVNGNGAVGAEQVLVDNMPAQNTNHNGGDLHFDNQGLLYVSVGDSGQSPLAANPNAQRLDLLSGKILRITRDGGIPSDNPYQGTGVACALIIEGQSPHGETCEEIFATGLRNPFRIVFDVNDSGFYVNDVGGAAWEEIDVGSSGANYGWPVREGPCPRGDTSNNCPTDNTFANPIFAYTRNALPEFSGCATITGGAFVPDAANWPSSYDGVYLFADLACQKIFALRGESPGQTPEVFATGTGAVHLAFGPDNTLHYTDFFGGGVRRILPGQAPPPDEPAPPPAPASVTTSPDITARSPVADKDARKKNDKKGKRNKNKHKQGKKKHDKNSGKNKKTSAKHKKSRARR